MIGGCRRNEGKEEVVVARGDSGLSSLLLDSNFGWVSVEETLAIKCHVGGCSGTPKRDKRKPWVFCMASQGCHDV